MLFRIEAGLWTLFFGFHGWYGYFCGGVGTFMVVWVQLVV